MSNRRKAVVDNARYLRNVRPIDPEEICEYVESQPHPAVVRQILREEAYALGLIERDDGSFVPVEKSAVPARRGPVREFPNRYASEFEALLVDRYGPSWYEDASGDLLRSTIRRVKSRYLQGASVSYDADVAAGYALYHLPGYFAAVQYALDDLAERGLIGRRLRVLDVGAGVGGPALGLFEYLPDDALVDYHAVEPSAAADVLETLLDATGRNIHATVHRTTAEAFDPVEAFEPAEPGQDVAEDESEDDTESEEGSGIDLILCCNVLSELDDPASVLRRYLDVLAPDGSLLAMAPADKRTSIGLRELERRVETRGGNTHDAGPDEVTVYGPAVRLWPGETPSDRGWSFDVRPDLSIPAFQRRLDETATDPDHEPGEFINVDVQFSYSILRRDGTRRAEIDLDPGRWAKMAEMDRHVTNRIDLVAAKLSRSLSDHRDGGSSNPLFKVSDGSEAVDHYAVVTAETSLNRALLEASYGDVLAFESVLALWNDDEEAYNLVVDEETIVDPVA